MVFEEGIGFTGVNPDKASASRVPSFAFDADGGDMSPCATFDHDGFIWILLLCPIVVAVGLFLGAFGVPFVVSEHEDIGT